MPPEELRVVVHRALLPYHQDMAHIGMQVVQADSATGPEEQQSSSSSSSAHQGSGSFWQQAILAGGGHTAPA